MSEKGVFMLVDCTASPQGLGLHGSTDAAIAALDRDGLVRLAMDLTDVASPTGYEEAAARLYRERMRQAGLVTRLQPIAPGRCNVLGTSEGTGGGRTLMFIAHLDTFLSVDEEGHHDLTEPPSAKVVDDQWVCGRGVSNMKGALAAYLAAVAAVREAGVGLSGDVLIAAVAGSMQNVPVDEFQGEAYRGYAVGSQHLLVRGGVADMCVMGEPTNFRIITQNFGHTQARISIRRRPGAADPASSPVDACAEVVRTLEAWEPDYRRARADDETSPLARVMGIKGGQPWSTDRSALANATTVFVHVMTPPDEHPVTVKHELRQALATVRERNPGLEITVELYATNPGASVPEDSPVVNAVREAHTQIFGKEPELGTVLWHSDAGHLNRYAVPTVNYGVSPRTGADAAPKDLGECLHIDDLLDITRVYADLIVRVCGGPT